MNKKIFIDSLTAGNGFYICSVPSEIVEACKNEICTEFSRLVGVAPKIGFEDLIHIHRQFSSSNPFPSLSVFDRTFGEPFSRYLSKSTWVNEIAKALGYDLVDNHGDGFATFTWRITRPNSPSDFGPLHRDFWFRQAMQDTDVLDPSKHFSIQTVKVWMAINVIYPSSGLLIKKDSHKDLSSPKYTMRKVNELVKPVLDEEVKDAELAPVTNGECIIFGEQLIHGGAPNTSNQCRLSVEFAYAPKNYQSAYSRFKNSSFT